MEAAQTESGYDAIQRILAERAYRIRRNALKMAAVQGRADAQGSTLRRAGGRASTRCATGRRILTGRTAIASACRSGTTPSRSTPC